ncbi:MAG: hypothetical protein D4R93_05615 [Deltaproteobacteria bacterium]|nr:MAG: hypothetical protein D4R93_05615 [Deltaproteobacteria bacterium]
MERRSFLKAGLLTISVLYGLPENIFSLQWNEVSAADRDSGLHPYAGTHLSPLADDLILMPDAFPRSSLKKDHILMVPEKNTSVLLLMEDSSEWKLLKQIFDARGKDDQQSFRERAKINEKGELYLPERVRRFAGIETSTVAIIGHGNVIEIIDPVKLNSRNK